eukprot:TRINITY_DN8018_c0_g1_i1.p1 TRINITY_DN8018_c0_g1~~TRINITY_DN8018_c0_g1_i1.p1  ORF type:complete len:114 (+),score=8.48 TRINITY_DN8018_c0_g1_i1:127-468(+)
MDASSHRWHIAKQKVLKLSKDMDEDLQSFLENVATLLHDIPGKTAYAPELGRHLPERIQAWMRDHGFRMCVVLAYYPMDFNVRSEGRGRIIELLRQGELRGIYPFCADGLICL